MLKNIPREDVIAVVKKIGPTIPARIVKELGGDTFLIGAILSDLATKGMVKVTHLKIGGSPFYYLPEQTLKLADLTKHLNEKDRETFEKLKLASVLKDEEQDPLQRVCLRNIKDFAKPLDVKIGEKQELFWKYYLLDNDAVKNIIKDKFMKKIEAKKEEKIVKKEPEVKAEIKKVIEAKKEESKIKDAPKIKEEKKEIKDEPKETKKESKKEEKIVEKQIQKPNPEKKKDEKQSKLEDKKEAKKIEKDTQKKQSEPEKSAEPENNFEKLLRYYFENKKIEIIEKIEAKKTEVDYIIRIPTPIGSVDYYCKAKDKKKCNEGDIATAYIQGQNRKLPILFLITGELNKKAEDMLTTDFKGVTVNKI